LGGYNIGRGLGGGSNRRGGGCGGFSKAVGLGVTGGAGLSECRDGQGGRGGDQRGSFGRGCLEKVGGSVSIGGQGSGAGLGGGCHDGGELVDSLGGDLGDLRRDDGGGVMDRPDGSVTDSGYVNRCDFGGGNYMFGSVSVTLIIMTPWFVVVHKTASRMRIDQGIIR